MADASKTARTLLSHQAITHPGIVVGTAIDVSDLFSGYVSIFHANIETTANDTGVSYKIQTSAASSGNDWNDYAVYVTGTSSAVTEALGGSEAIDQTVLGVASTTGFSDGDFIYLKDNDAVNQGEWLEAENVISNTSIDVVDGIERAHGTSDALWTKAERTIVYLNLEGILRIRAVVVHRASTGSNIHFKVLLTTLDAVS